MTKTDPTKPYGRDNPLGPVTQGAVVAALIGLYLVEAFPLLFLVALAVMVIGMSKGW
jgi:hypothetical protein